MTLTSVIVGITQKFTNHSSITMAVASNPSRGTVQEHHPSFRLAVIFIQIRSSNSVLRTFQLVKWPRGSHIFCPSFIYLACNSCMKPCIKDFSVLLPLQLQHICKRSAKNAILHVCEACRRTLCAGLLRHRTGPSTTRNSCRPARCRYHSVRFRDSRRWHLRSNCCRSTYGRPNWYVSVVHFTNSVIARLPRN